MLLLEVFLRVFDPVGISYFWEIDKYEHARLRGQPFDYIHKPGYRAKLQGVDVVINGRGLRTPEFDDAKRSGTRRVLILGDSIVFGWGVAQDEIVSAQLQRMLDERTGESWEVIGAGVMSWNTRTEYEYLVEEFDRIEADVIVLILSQNDAVPHENGRTSVALDTLLAELDLDASRSPKWYRAIVDRSYVLATVHLSTRGRILAETRAQKFCDGISPASRDTRAALEGIVALASENDARLIPYLYATSESECTRLFEETLARKGVHMRRFPTELEEKRYRNSMVDPHPNAAGHRLMAEAIVRDLHEDMENAH